MAAKKKSVAKKPAAKKAAKKSTIQKATRPAIKKAAVKKPAVRKAAVKKPVVRGSRKTPQLVVVPEARPESVTTTIVARFDAGFGNALYVRGSGAGLDWDRGVVMECRGSDEWSYATDAVSQPVEVKLLINDATWSVGANVVVRSGETIVLAPTFEETAE